MAEIDQSDEYWWWREAAKDPSKIGTPPLLLYESQPMPGLYRIRDRDSGDWQAVVIGLDEITGKMGGSVNGKPVRDVEALWVRCCGQPIVDEIYDRFIETGEWPDEPPRFELINLSSDPFEALEQEFEGERDLVEQFLREPIRTQDDADRAAIWAGRFLDITRRANLHHGVERKPFDDEVERVDRRWRTLRTVPADLARRLKKHQGDWLAELDRREQERVAAAKREVERKRREAQELADRAEAEARAAERAAAQAVDQEAARAAQKRADQALAEAGAKISEAKQAEREAVYHNPSAGRTGARTALRTMKAAVVNDWNLLFEHLKDREEMRALAQKLADAAARANVALPGCTIAKTRKPA